MRCVAAARPENVVSFYGAGLRSFCVAPVALPPFLEALRALDPLAARQAVKSAMASSCPTETRSHVAGYKHGYAPS